MPDLRRPASTASVEPAYLIGQARPTHVGGPGRCQSGEWSAMVETLSNRTLIVIGIGDR